MDPRLKSINDFLSERERGPQGEVAAPDGKETGTGVKSAPPSARGTAPRSLLIIAPLVVIGLGALLTAGILPRISNENALQAQQLALANKVPLVTTAIAKVAPGNNSLVLPANIQAIQEIPIYARSDGYLKQRMVDIGDLVHTNQLLMVIDTPEVKQQVNESEADAKQAQAALKSAQADYAQAVSNLASSKATVRKGESALVYSSAEVQRYTLLAKQGAVSYEQRDQNKNNFDSDTAALDAAKSSAQAAESQVASAREKVAVATATVEMKKATLERTRSLESFQRVLAPCDGVITARNVDAGALVSAGSNSNNTEMLRMARTDVMRIFVLIPQSFYHAVKVGEKADVTVSELPGEVFSGTIVHLAGALDPVSRTLQAEVHIPNKDHKLMPGTYAQVRLTATRQQPPVIIPSTALDVKTDGEYVAIVSSDHKIHYVKVEIGRDNGPDVELTSGLKGGEMVVLEPTDDLSEGKKVSARLKKEDKSAH